MLGFAKKVQEQAKLCTTKEGGKVYALPPSVKAKSSKHVAMKTLSHSPYFLPKTTAAPKPSKKKASTPVPVTPKYHKPKVAKSMVMPSPLQSFTDAISGLNLSRAPKTPIFPTPPKASKVLKESKKKPHEVIDLTRPRTPYNIFSTIPATTPCPRSKPQATKPQILKAQTQKAKVTKPKVPSRSRVVHQNQSSGGLITPPAAAILQRWKIISHWQVDMARDLHRTGLEGPFEIGDYLCYIDPVNGKCIKKATSKIEVGTGQAWWIDMETGRPFEAINFHQEPTEVYGSPVRGPFGSLIGFEGAYSPPRNSRESAQSEGVDEDGYPRLKNDPMLF
jgi:hypothetical protein